MKTTHEFFQGLIAQDFQEILNAAPAPDALRREAAGAKKPASGKPVCKPAEKPKTGAYCKGDEGSQPTQDPSCSCDSSCRPAKKKTGAFLPSLPGWSSPPAPPVF
jgi:hypothetical protein